MNNFTIEVRTTILTAFTFILCFYLSTAYAEEERQLSLLKTVHIPISHDKSVTLDASELSRNDCKEIFSWIASDGPSYRNYLKANALGEMFDRGICGPLDPTRAYDAFKAAARVFFKSDVHPITAWKLWYGDGVPEDRKEATRQFRQWIVTITLLDDPTVFSKQYPENRLAIMQERPLPRWVRKGLNWHAEMMTDTKSYMEWAARLYIGKAVFLDGTVLPANPESAENIYTLNFSHEEQFIFARTLFDEASNIEDKRYAELSLQLVAQYDFLPAIIKLFNIYKNPKTEFYNKQEALRLANIARKLGAKIEY